MLALLRDKGSASTASLIKVIYGRKERPYSAAIIACGTARSLSEKSRRNGEPYTILNMGSKGRPGALWRLVKKKR